jgi:hypothetical protein
MWRGGAEGERLIWLLLLAAWSKMPMLQLCMSSAQQQRSAEPGNQHVYRQLWMSLLCTFVQGYAVAVT